jgi:hypothetical protein
VAEVPADGERYARLRDELWFAAREWLEGLGARLPKDADLIAELTAATYRFTSAGKLQVEAKDEMKKRAGRSPDLADAFCLTFGPDHIPGLGLLEYYRSLYERQVAGV